MHYLLKKLLAASSLMLGLGYGVLGQKASFDLASFTPPAGWQTNDLGGAVTYTTTDTSKGTLCILTLYRSTDGSGNADTDFSREWNSKMITPFGTSAGPKIRKVAAKNGWESRIGVDTFSKNGIHYLGILSVMSGYHKAMDMLVITNRKEYLTTLDNFYSSIEMQRPTATGPANATAGAGTVITGSTVAGVSVATGDLNAIRCSLPKGWTEGRTSGGLITAASPLLECTGQSYYTLYVNGVIDYDGDLQELGGKIHKSYFYQPDPVFQYPEAGRRVVKGIDEQGREFLSYEAPSCVFKTDNSWHYGYVYLLRSGGRVASFMLELRPQNRDRFGSPSAMTLYFLYGCNAVRSAWNKFAGSIAFVNPGPRAVYDPADLTGRWECRVTLGASIWGYVSDLPLQKYHFGEDGRWQSEKMITQNNFGKYRVSDDKLVITDGAGKTISYRFKLERVFEYNNWSRHITLYDSNGTETQLVYEGD
ncbi:hypothetical protein Q4E93_06675 [Flavitalea sp. BT771]|uniref:hypothetical protein n=1 Tax=Flavitalea sp. BT771 TaxID=3063329 RepID=UPI0026E362EF|nr:hypothetical protein [Flavitalea sp. BT771]MDO6430260.1 hypothetical protein [Flavitalea sp. BT771]MDV6219600.1 hypothetical protein [Flavitalea sp. BT771]